MSEMSAKERMQAFLGGRPYDRIPCNALLSEHAATVLGVTVAEYHQSASCMARAQIAAYRTYGLDGVGVGPGLIGFAEAAGSRVAFPDTGSAFIEDYAVRSEADLDRLTLPDSSSAGRFPLFYEALTILVEEVGDEVPVGAAIGGPFTTAANLRGAEHFLRDLTLNPQFAHRLLDFSLGITVAFIREVAALPIGFTIADPVCSGSLISSKAYREFAFPYQRRLVDEIQALSGRRPTLHICGNTRRIWPLMVDTGAAVLSLDNVVDLAEAKAAVGDKVILTGNIHPTETMFHGTPRTVGENVRECLRKAWDSPRGFILGLGCGLPIHTPPANVHALFDAARRYGRYPLDPAMFT